VTPAAEKPPARKAAGTKKAAAKNAAPKKPSAKKSAPKRAPTGAAREPEHPLDLSGLNESVPRFHARRLPTPSRRDLLRRSVRIGRIGTRRFAPVMLRQARYGRRGLSPAAFARPLRLTVEELGGTFMKFGQLVASSPGLFGDEVADEFRSCLDTGPMVPFAVVKDRVERDLGMDLRDAFTEFDPQPVGRASIAVVHRARLRPGLGGVPADAPDHEGREVAVKVLRPGIEHLVATDLDLMQPFFYLLAKETGDQMAGSTLQLVDGLRQQLGEELDLRNEARALAHFRALGRQMRLPLVVVPEPFPELSGPHVLTMEFLHGIPIDDFAQVAALGYDPAPLVEAVVRAFFITTVRWGAFHGDVHAGNLLLLHDGRIGVIDWGIVGRLDPDTHRFLIRLLEAVMGDESAWPDITEHLTRTYGRTIQEGLGFDDDELTAFLRGLIEPTLTRPFGEVSLAALMEAPQRQAALAQGADLHRRTLRSVLARLRAQRPAAPVGRRVGRAQQRLRPGELPARQAAHVLRALRKDVPGRRAAHARPRVLRGSAVGRRAD
jgi:predicted unusual protein kinase regulating ubiquinone biosynthesis (AarF/ABC1/UbiB family)